MTMRQTPFQRIRYPWTSDVASAADLQSMGSDIDQGIVQAANLGADFSRFSSVLVTRAAAQSIAKGTLTAITFDTVVLDNGTDSPLANGAWWSAGAPTRLTAPSACIVLAAGNGMLNFGAVAGSPATLQTTIALNGAASSPGVQGGKYSPLAAASGQMWMPSVLSMWKLVAGDFLELKFFWTGTPAGPFSTDTSFRPSLSLMMVALPSVP